MTEIEKVKSEIKVLEEKLSFLEELEKTKSPVEEAFKRVYGAYPNDIIGNPNNESYWYAFRNGYNSAQGDYKVGEYQEPEELKTLYQILYEDNLPVAQCKIICEFVKKWMSQYTHNVMSGEYLRGYEDCMLVLEQNLKND